MSLVSLLPSLTSFCKACYKDRSHSVSHIVTCFSQPTSFVALTPKADESLIGVDLMLVVIYSGGFAQNLPLKFQYVGNPQVVDITPKVTLAK